MYCTYNTINFNDVEHIQCIIRLHEKKIPFAEKERLFYNYNQRFFSGAFHSRYDLYFQFTNLYEVSLANNKFLARVRSQHRSCGMHWTKWHYFLRYFSYPAHYNSTNCSTFISQPIIEAILVQYR
jgi:hypothetical protein